MVQLEDLHLDLTNDSLEPPSFVDLENFFARHPRIHTLHIKGQLEKAEASNFKFRQVILPNLSSLTAHPVHLISFLNMQQSHPNTLLHLKSVKLMPWHDTFASTCNYDSFDTALAPLANISGNNITLTLTLMHPASTWLENHVVLGPQSVLHQLTCVSHLVLWGVTGFETMNGICDRAVLLHWLNLFPSVQSLELVDIEHLLGDGEFLKLI